jgi:AcrR family transcriptional regulator
MAAMDTPVPPVDRRRERSRRTRRRIVEAAYRLFVERGYGVPLAEVASEANVSVQNLYVAFRSKQVLVGEVLQLAVLGDDLPIPPHHRPWFRELLDAPDARSAISVWVVNTLPIYARVAPLAGMFLSEPELAEMWARSETLRIDGFRFAMEQVMPKGRPRAGVDLDGATDTMFALLGPLMYEELVGGRGWTPDRWGAWVTDLVVRALFED